MEIVSELAKFQIEADVEKLYRDGITALRGAFSQEWVHRMRDDMMTVFWESIQRPGGAIGRGPRRWYVEVHPQMISGCIELATHPWVLAMSEAVLGLISKLSSSASMFPSRERCTSRGTATFHRLKRRTNREK